jgi:NitT/TauT family transport system ATP-binding protein
MSADGEFLSLLGPSGCGKSTFLRVVADLIAPTSGSRAGAGVTPETARMRRDIGFVFQDAALLPWRTALQNVELPLEVARGRADTTSAARATPRELLELVGLKGSENAYPHELSGGMRQRVSIARALVTDPAHPADGRALRRAGRDHARPAQRGTAARLARTRHDRAVRHPQHLRGRLPGQRVLMLAANPGRVQEIVPVDLPAGRTLASARRPNSCS